MNTSEALNNLMRQIREGRLSDSHLQMSAQALSSHVVFLRPISKKNGKCKGPELSGKMMSKGKQKPDQVVCFLF